MNVAAHWLEPAFGIYVFLGLCLKLEDSIESSIFDPSQSIHANTQIASFRNHATTNSFKISSQKLNLKLDPSIVSHTIQRRLLTNQERIKSILHKL